MNKFYTSGLCQERQSCVSCRRDPSFRRKIDKQFATGLDFPCPHGITAENVGDEVNKPIDFAKTAGRVVQNIVRREDVFLSKEECDQRLMVCYACPFYDAARDKCLKCNCPTTMSRKARIRAAKCPRKLWPKIDCKKQNSDSVEET